jgi:probable HAF family extracellular repeat protein
MILSTAIVLLIGTRVEAASLTYSITDLGTLPGTSLSIATGINDSGQVVGYSESSTGSQSFLYSNGQMTPISDPVSGAPAGGINNLGQIVSQGQFINNSGQIVSSSQPFQISISSTVNGVTTTVQTTFNPGGINDAGQILGSIVNPSDPSLQQDMGIYKNGKFFDITKALGLTSDTTIPMAINNAGSVLFSDFHPNTDTTTYVVYKADGTSQILSLGGPATAMNSVGQVVGNGQVSSIGTGVLYSNGSYLALPALLPPSSQSLWQFLNPTAINDEGQIVGSGVIDGQVHAFLMTPTPAPEPTTLALLTTSIVAFSIREWSRRRKPR